MLLLLIVIILFNSLITVAYESRLKQSFYLKALGSHIGPRLPFRFLPAVQVTPSALSTALCAVQTWSVSEIGLLPESSCFLLHDLSLKWRPVLYSLTCLRVWFAHFKPWGFAVFSSLLAGKQREEMSSWGLEIQKTAGPVFVMIDPCFDNGGKGKSRNVFLSFRLILCQGLLNSAL